MPKLSVVLATHNEENNIGACLESIKCLAGEIVIVDGSSTDKTRVIGKSFGAKIFIVPNRLMFHRNKQLALEKASGEWILQLDADERVMPSLCEEIKSTINHQPSTINGYYIPRKNYFLGKWLRKGGQYPDYIIRVVRRGKAYFPCETVHEQIKVEGKVNYLKNPLIHLANANLKSYFIKAEIYTSETALKLKKEKARKNIISSFNFLVVKPIYTFFNIFIRHKGFVDGFYGLLFALFSALHHQIAYIKYLKLK